MSSASSRIVSLEQAKRWKGNNQKNEKEKENPEKSKLTPWLELWVIESPVVTTMMKMKRKVVLPFAVPSAKKEKDYEIQKKKKKIRITQKRSKND